MAQIFVVAPASAAALYAMERPASREGPPTPHPSFMEQPAPPAAAGTAFQRYAVIHSTSSDAAAPAQEPAAAAEGGGVQHGQLLDELRDRLASFPVDNLSPTTTATALSLAYLPPAGNSEYGEDEPSPYIDLAVGPVSEVLLCHSRLLFCDLLD